MTGMTGQMIEPMTPGGRSCGADGPYKDLAIAVVRLAVKDYISVLMRLARMNAKKNARKSTKNTAEAQQALLRKGAELESFFYSEWYEELCDIDGGYLSKMSQEKAIEKLVEQEKKREEKNHEK